MINTKPGSRPAAPDLLDLKQTEQTGTEPPRTPQPQHKLRILSYNIDTNIIRAESGYARDSHPQWRANARVQSVVQVLDDTISKKHPTVIQIQECRKFSLENGEVVDTVTPIYDALRKKGYDAVIRPYNESGGDKAFQFITAYDPSQLTLKQSFMYYVSKTPNSPTPRPSGRPTAEEEAQIKDNNFGAFFERGFLVTQFEHVSMKEPVFCINAHADIPENIRLRTSDSLVALTRELLERAPNAKIIVTGDFNTFPDRGGPQQLELISSAQIDGTRILEEVTAKLRTPQGDPAQFSFIPFPYDFIGLKPDTIDAALIDQIEPETQRQLVRETFAKFAGANFNMNDFLTALEPNARKKVIGLVFAKCTQPYGILDRVFQHGFDNQSSKAVIRPAPLFSIEEAALNDSDSVRRYILENHDNGPAFASDHQPVLTTLKSV